MTKLVPVLIYAMFAGVLLVALYVMFLGARNIWRGLASPQWPKAPGLVVNSDTSAELTSVTDNVATTQAGNALHYNQTQYAANITFRYHVNGREYTTPLLYFGQTVASADPTEAQLRHLRYPQGADVTIFYNPSDPAIAAAEPGFHSESLLLLIAGVGFAIPVIMAALAYRGMSAIPTTLPVRGLTNAPDLSAPFSNGVFSGMPIIVGLFASVFALLGIGALTLGLINLARAHASLNWPTAPGVIAYQDLGPNLTSHLIFTYEINGAKRYSNLRRFGLLASTSDEQADKDQAKYPQGQAVTVTYSPDNPNLAVLEPGIENEAYVLPGIGLALLLFASGVVFIILPAISKPF